MQDLLHPQSSVNLNQRYPVLVGFNGNDVPRNMAAGIRFTARKQRWRKQLDQCHRDREEDR